MSTQMDDEEFNLILLYWLYRRNRRRRNAERSVWCRQFILDREGSGHGSNLVPALRLHHPDLFKNYTRMSCSQFDFLLSLVGDKLKKNTTRLRKPISPSCRLLITLRFLATGCSYAEISYGFRVGKSTVCGIVKETCATLVEVLKPEYLKMPETDAAWKDIATGYEYKWNFPHCVGAIDGKHVAIQAPAASGSSFINYKGFHSIVLMAACDAFYCFTFIDAGSYGRMSDGGVFKDTFLSRQLSDNRNMLPSPSQLPASTKVTPYVFVADEAFPLMPNLMRPFPGRYLENEKKIYNYRLSRARRCIENSFGIMSSRWRVLRTTMALCPENATLVTVACCCLHNFLMKLERPYADRTYCPASFADRDLSDGSISAGGWRTDGALISVQRQGANRASQVAINVRETFKDFFNAEGALAWQNRFV